jgi:hypothetical protein
MKQCMCLIQAKKAEPAPAPKESGGAEGGRKVKKVTRLGMEVKKEDNFAAWYSQVCVVIGWDWHAGLMIH